MPAIRIRKRIDSATLYLPELTPLRAAGVTVPFPDVVIAALAIANDVELWTRDAQFITIRGVLPQLKLFQEPP